jgi:hypothetical protein
LSLFIHVTLALKAAGFSRVEEVTGKTFPIMEVFGWRLTAA